MQGTWGIEVTKQRRRSISHLKREREWGGEGREGERREEKGGEEEEGEKERKN